MSMLNNAIFAVKETSMLQNRGGSDAERIQTLQKHVSARFPMTLKILRFIDANINEKKQNKGYYLVQRSNKKHNFLYYVRYIHEGKTIASMWNTHTNVREEAEIFAFENRNRIVSEYTAKKDDSLFTMFRNYYEADSKYFIDDQSRNGKLCDKLRRGYLNFIIKHFIPFLENQKIYSFAGITSAIIAKFQTVMLKKRLKPQTINGYLSSLKRIFKTFILSGEIDDNIFTGVSSLKVLEENVKIRGCHEVEKLNGVFNDEWNEDKRSYLLCLMIYATGLRNSEICNLKVSDIIKIDDCYFLNISKSKTRNGVRIVPLHSFLHKKLIEYIEEKGLSGDGFIFKKQNAKNIDSKVYKKSNLLLAEKIGVDKAYLSENNISFYSGRHFWKTLMSSEELGAEIEELFMGHKVSGDVAKRYNHRDKIGKEKLLKKTRKAFAILDDKLFGKRTA
jgi:integrase